MKSRLKSGITCPISPFPRTARRSKFGTEHIITTCAGAGAGNGHKLCPDEPVNLVKMNPKAGKKRYNILITREIITTESAFSYRWTIVEGGLPIITSN